MTNRYLSDMTDSNRPRTVRLEPSVTEEWVRRVMAQRASPNEFAEWLLSTVDLRLWLTRFQEEAASGSEKMADNTSDEADNGAEVRHAAPLKPTASSDRGDDEEGGWSKELFFAFLEVVSSIEELEWSMALLTAYRELGPMPSSDRLQDLCGFRGDHAWQQELRIAKQRLTLQARKMDAPPLFPRAKSTSEGTRMHPIEPRLFPWLKQWLEEQARGEDGIEGGGLPQPEQWGPTIEQSDKYSEAGT